VLHPTRQVLTPSAALALHRDLIVAFAPGRRRDVIRLTDALIDLTGTMVDVVDEQAVWARAKETGIGASILSETMPGRTGRIHRVRIASGSARSGGRGDRRGRGRGIPNARLDLNSKQIVGSTSVSCEYRESNSCSYNYWGARVPRILR
jgi:hypothetical protein